MARNRQRRRTGARPARAVSPREQQLLGAAHAAHQQGNVPLAEQGYRDVLQMNPRSADALHLYAILCHQTGRQQQALELMERAVSVDPASAALRSNRGEVLRAAGRLEEALASYREATRLAPDFADAWNNAALVLAALGRLQEAERHARRVVKLAPQALEGHMVLAGVLWAGEDLGGCRAACERALAIDPGCAEAALKAGLCSLALGDQADARARLEAALALAPDMPQVRLALADLELAAGDAQTAHGHLQALSADAAASADALLRRGRCLVALGRQAEAIEPLRRLVGEHPDDVDAGILLAWAEAEGGELEAGLARLAALAERTGRADLFVDLGRLQALQASPAVARQSFEQALAMQPRHAGALRGRAEMLLAEGELDAARDGLRAAIAADPADAYAYETLAGISRRTDWDSALYEQLCALGENPGLDAAARAAALFARAHLLDGAGDYDDAFACLARANALMAAQVHYDAAAQQALADAVVETFDGRFDPALGSDERRPVFIVGMPRSGTSLVEQILASHPQVAGAGEVEYFAHLRFAGGQRYPHGCRDLHAGDATRLREDYLARLDRIDATAPHVTDKMPANYLYLGLIHTLFPRARIIHCRRDPMDTGLSIYFQNFTAAAGNAFAFDLANIAHQQRICERLMEHWQRLFGAAILALDYEQLVADPESQTRAMLAHLQLPWDEACLSFHRTRRAVRTASHFQVRQPLYQHAVARWHRYRAQLAPLAAALQGSG